MTERYFTPLIPREAEMRHEREPRGTLATALARKRRGIDVGGKYWKGPFQEGDLVEYVGDEGPYLPARGDLGRLFTPGEVGDPPPSWVVMFESAGTAVFGSEDLRPAPTDITVRELEPGEDRSAVDAFLEEHNALHVARLAELVDARRHPALVAEEDGRLVGVLTYIIDGDRCEILTLHAAEKQRGIGRALMQKVQRIAGAAGCRVLWVVTTNDNLDAIRFYQRRMFRLAELHAGAVDESRRTLKPEIPVKGEFGIFIHDELVLEKPL